MKKLPITLALHSLSLSLTHTPLIVFFLKKPHIISYLHILNTHLHTLNAMLGFGIEKGFHVHGSCAFRSSTFISITKLDLIFIMFIKTGVWSSSCLSKPRSLKAKPYDNSTTRWHSCCRAVPVAEPHQFSNLISSNSNFLSKDGGKHEFFWLRNREGQWPEEEGAISDSHTHTYTYLLETISNHTHIYLLKTFFDSYIHTYLLSLLFSSSSCSLPSTPMNQYHRHYAHSSSNPKILPT